MGCGKSKHDVAAVATGNTVTNHRQKSDVAAQTINISKDVDSIPEKVTDGETTAAAAAANVVVLKENEESGNHANKDDHQHDVQNDQTVVVAASAAANSDVKDDEIADQKTELIKEEETITVESSTGDHHEEKEGDGAVAAVAVAAVADVDVVEDQPEPDQRLISRESPNRYFSSRKEEEAVESVVSEITSDYDSPRHDNGRDDDDLHLLKETEKAGGDAMDQKKLDEKAKPEADNDQVAKTVGAETENVAIEKNNVKAEEENLTDSLKKDAKTN